jgi:hypothetical protein
MKFSIQVRRALPHLCNEQQQLIDLFHRDLNFATGGFNVVNER